MFTFESDSVLTEIREKQTDVLTNLESKLFTVVLDTIDSSREANRKKLVRETEAETDVQMSWTPGSYSSWSAFSEVSFPSLVDSSSALAAAALFSANGGGRPNWSKAFVLYSGLPWNSF